MGLGKFAINTFGPKFINNLLKSQDPKEIAKELATLIKNRLIAFWGKSRTKYIIKHSVAPFIAKVGIELQRELLKDMD
jgi:hypothetical protein